MQLDLNDYDLDVAAESWEDSVRLGYAERAADTWLVTEPGRGYIEAMLALYDAVGEWPEEDRERCEALMLLDVLNRAAGF